MEVNNLENKVEITNEIVNEKEQKDFLETTLGKTINFGLDIGIRALLPDFIEEQVINLKDNLFNYGFKDGIKKTIDDAIDIGKSAIGIFTGNFESVSQMQEAVKTGGLIDGISGLLDNVLGKIQKAGVLDSKIVNILSQGKNIILNNVENNIEKNFSTQIENIENVENYINEWNKYYKNQDFTGMEKQYNKIEKILKDLAPIENVLNKAREIETLHNLIKNNGQNFNLSTEELELARKL